MTHANNKADNPSIWLLEFDIETTSGSQLLYANGRQQVEVTLTLKTKEAFPLTTLQKESLCIVVQQSNGEYVRLPDEVGVNSWWASETQGVYDYYPIAAKEQPSITNKRNELEQAETFYQKRFYVMTRATAGDAIKLRAQVSRSADETYQSIIPFEHSVTLTSVRTPDFSAPDNYTLTRRLVSGNENLGRFVYEYQLYPTNMIFKSAEVLPLGMIQWDDRNPAETRASNVGFAGPNQPAFSYDEDIITGDAFKEERVMYVTYQSPGRLSIVLQGGINIPYHSNSAIYHNGPCKVNGIDMNGNDHAVGVQFNGASGFVARTNLEITSI